MTFKVRVRGAGSYMVAEYRCPKHSVFEVLVQRDANGDAPDFQPCECDEPAPFTISAPAIESEALKVRAVTRGGDMAERPKGMLDTRKLAEGQTMTEWKKERTLERKRRRHDQLIAKGARPKRIQVG